MRFIIMRYALHFLLVIYFFISGCASQNALLTEEVLKQSFDQSGLTTLLIYVKDDQRRQFQCLTFQSSSESLDSCGTTSGFSPSQYHPLAVLLNGQVIGYLYHNNVLKVQLAPGRYYLAYKSDFTLKRRDSLYVGNLFEIAPGVSSVSAQFSPLEYHALLSEHLNGQTLMTQGVSANLSSKQVMLSKVRLKPLTHSQSEVAKGNYLEDLKKLEHRENAIQFYTHRQDQLEAENKQRWSKAVSQGLAAGANDAIRQQETYQSDIKKIRNIPYQFIGAQRTTAESIENSKDKDQIEVTKPADKNTHNSSQAATRSIPASASPASASASSSPEKDYGCWSGQHAQGSCLEYTTYEKDNKTYFKLKNICRDRLYMRWCADKKCGSDGLAAGETKIKYEYTVGAKTSALAVGSKVPSSDWVCNDQIGGW